MKLYWADVCYSLQGALVRGREAPDARNLKAVKDGSLSVWEQGAKRYESE